MAEEEYTDEEFVDAHDDRVVDALESIAEQLDGIDSALNWIFLIMLFYTITYLIK